MREEKVLGSGTAQRQTICLIGARHDFEPSSTENKEKMKEEKQRKMYFSNILRYEFTVDYPAKLQRGVLFL